MFVIQLFKNVKYKLKKNMTHFPCLKNYLYFIHNYIIARFYLHMIMLYGVILIVSDLSLVWVINCIYDCYWTTDYCRICVSADLVQEISVSYCISYLLTVRLHTWSAAPQWSVVLPEHFSDLWDSYFLFAYTLNFSICLMNFKFFFKYCHTVEQNDMIFSQQVIEL